MIARRLARWMAVALLVCLTLVAVAAVVSTTPWFKGQVRHLLVGRVGALLEGHLQVGALTGSLFGNATLHDVVVLQDGQPTLQIGAVTARYDLLQIALGRLSVDAVELHGMALRVVETPAGWNIGRLVRPRERQPESAPWSIAVGRLEVIEGTILVQPLHGPERSLADLNLEAAIRYTSPALEVSLHRLSVRDVHTGLSVTRVAGDISLDDTSVRVQRVTLATPASALRGHAAYRWGSEADIDAAVELQPVALAEVDAYLPPSVGRALVLTGSASVRGPIEAVAVAWDLDTGAGRSSANMTVGLDRREDVRLDGTVAADRLNLAPLTNQPHLASDVTLRADVRGVVNRTAPARSRVTFAVRAPRLQGLGYEARHVDATGSLAAGTLRVRGTVQAYGAAARIEATVEAIDRPRARAISAAGRIDDLNLRSLPPALGVPAIATDIAGDYSLDVRGEAWRADVTLSASRLEDVVVDEGTRVVAESSPGRFAAAVEGRMAGVGPALLHLPVDRRAAVAGSVRARVVLPGLARPTDLHDVEAEVTANLAGSTFDDVRLEAADIDVALANGLLDVRRFELQGGGLDVSAQGGAALGDSGESHLTLKAAVNDLAALAPFGVDELSGAFHLEGLVTGPAGALVAAGTYNAHQLRFRNVLDALALNGTFKAAVTDQQWANVTADVDMESAFLMIRGYDLQQLSLRSRYQAGAIDLDGRFEQKARVVDLDGSVVLHADHQEVHLRQLSVAGPGSPWRLEGPEAVITYGAGSVGVNGLVFVRDQERVEASGTLTLGGSRPSDLRLRFQGVQVGDVYTMAFGAPVVTGTAAGEMTVSGVLPGVEVTGRLDVEDGRVAQVAYSRAGANVAFKDGRVEIDARVDEAAGSALTVRGGVPIGADGGALDVRVHSPGVSLGLVQAFTSHLANVQGQAVVDLHATGPLAAPDVTGQVAVTGGGFLVTATGVTYQDLHADVVFQGRRAITREFRVTDDDGHPLTMTAGADVFGNGQDRTFEVAIDADSLQVLQNELGDVEVDIRIRAEGTLAAPRLTGRVALDQGRLEVDELLRRFAPRGRAPSDLRPGLAPTLSAEASTPPDEDPAAQTEEQAQTHRPASGLFSRASMDLDIVVPDALVLRGRDVRAGAGSMALGNLNITIGGNLDLTKAAGAEPLIRGSLGVVRGFYEFQGRRFDVTRGSSVSFRGPDPANPTLDVTGERTVQGVVARVAVTGTLRQPRLALSSTPPLDEGDVLSLIVFNQPINQLGEAEQVDLLDRAGALAVGTLATSLSQSIGSALDVDLFEIRAPGSGSAGEVTVGRQVNDRLFIGFRQEFAGGDASRLSLEYQITDALRILTSVAQGVARAKRSRDQDTAGIDLIYQVRY